MDWNDVDAFCCVIEYGGFTAAAKAMSRPKSSVSASVARLEAELGARLLQRTTRRVRPTEAGESLYQDSAAMFQRLRDVRANAMARGKAVAGTLRVAAPYEFGAHHLGAVACRMLARYPELRIDIDVEHGRVDPLDRSYDIVFSYFDDDRPDSGRAARRVFELKRGIFAAPALLARHPRVAAPQDLAELPAIASPLMRNGHSPMRRATRSRFPCAPACAVPMQTCAGARRSRASACRASCTRSARTWWTTGG